MNKHYIMYRFPFVKRLSQVLDETHKKETKMYLSVNNVSLQLNT